MPALQVPENAAIGPVAKRQKVQPSNGKSDATVARKSKIFAPFRVRSPAHMVRGYDADRCRR
jgi:U3 small nucleolar RNA-associated protein 21